MNVLRQPNKKIVKILGDNKRYLDINYRLMKFVLVEDAPKGGKLLYNYLTGAFIWMPEELFANIYSKKDVTEYLNFLYKNYFLVKEDFDEISVVDKLKKDFRPKIDPESYLKNGNISEYTIFTTMACNAQCFYCYEKGRPLTPMKHATAEKVGLYIINTCVKTGKEIRLRWFGGEPLVNEKVIDIICGMVKEAGLKYSSSIISNGLLFKEEKTLKYKNLWKLVSAQITIDGTEEVYNKTKNYKNVKIKTSPYKIVTKNVEMLAKMGINISIRMNMDLYNAEDIKNLVRELSSRWKFYKNISLYCYPIFEDPENPRTPEERHQVYLKLEEIELVLKECGNSLGKGLGQGIRATHCMVDNGHAVVIQTDGSIALCEHYSEGESFSHIDDPSKKDWEVIKSWQLYKPALDICRDCPTYPICILHPKCEDLKNCNEDMKLWRIREGRYAMLEEFKRANNRKPQKLNSCSQLKKEEKKEEKIGFLKRLLIYFKLI